MTFEKYLRELGIDKVGTYAEDDSYVVDLDDSKDFGEMYSKLDRSELDPLDYSSIMTVHNASLLYQFENIYQVSLIADFDEDTYKMVFREL